MSSDMNEFNFKSSDIKRGHSPQGVPPQKKDNKIFKIVFWVVAGVLIIGLCAAILYILFKKDDAPITQEELVNYVAQVSEEATNIYNGDSISSYEEAMEVFDDAIDNASSDDEMFDLEMARVSLLRDNNRLEEAIKYLGQVNMESLSDEQLATVYNTFFALYMMSGDSEKAQSYYQMFLDLGVYQSGG